ncbi:MAG: fibronectin type III domain-containing protein [Acidobacteriota bacterium]
MQDQANHRRRLQEGFSLVELTVAFAIFLVAALAAYALYYGGTRSFKQAENATDVQQNARTGFDRLTRELRLAGFNQNADGAAARPDEQFEGAWDTAITIRGDFDAEDPALSTTPETSLAGTFNVVTTGNDEIVTYALGKPALPNSTAISYTADVAETTRDGDEEAVSIPGPVLVQDDPPYTLYRISPKNVSSMGGFDGAFDSAAEFLFEPIAENIRSLTFKYFDVSGALINPDTPADPTDDIGGGDANRNQRARITRVELDLEAMTPEPDPQFIDPADPNPATQNFRKIDLTASVTPRNTGLKGIPDLDLQPPSTPTGLAACPGHCAGILLTWNANPPSELVTEYRVAYGTSTGNLTTTRTTSQTSLFINALNPAATYYFSIQALDAAGNASPPSAEISATTLDDTEPGLVPGFAAAGSTADPGILVSWTPVTQNDNTVAGASGPGGCDVDKPLNRDLDGYALFRNQGGDPATSNLGSALAGPTTLNQNAVQYLDTAVVACRNYTYDIRAVDACGTAGGNQASTVTTSYTTTVPPAKPQNVNASESGVNKNTIVWDAVTADAGGKPTSVAGYHIYRAEAPPGNPPGASLFTTPIGFSNTNSYVDNYTGGDPPATGNIYYYRITALDDCPNESELSAASGASCAFDGQVIITPGAGTTVFGVQTIQLTADGTDTYVQGSVTVFDETGNSVLGPLTSMTYPFSFTWDTRSLNPGPYLITGAIVNATGCNKTSSAAVQTITTPACCLTQTSTSLASDNKANSNLVAGILANLCQNNLVASAITVTFNLTDSKTKLDDIRWNGVSIISGVNHTSPFSSSISVPIPSTFNGGGQQDVVFDFDRTLVPGDIVSFDLTYSGPVVSTQTCTFTSVVN